MLSFETDLSAPSAQATTPPSKKEAELYSTLLGNVLNEEDLARERHGRTQLEALIQASGSLCKVDASDKSKGKATTILECSTKSSRYFPFSIALGGESPPKQGFERTGTRPFMALTLMENPDGSLKRTRTHELESFIWIFAWIVEGDKSKERRSWRHPSFSQAALIKRTYWAARLKRKSYPHSLRPSNKAFWEQLCALRVRWDTLVNQEELSDVCASPQEFMTVFNQAFPREHERMTWDWLTVKVAEIPRT